MHENLDAILARTSGGPSHFSTSFATAPWLYDERYLVHIVVGINSRMTMLQQQPEWAQLGPKLQHAHTFFALLRDFATSLPTGDTLSRIGCPSVPYQVLEAVQQGILEIEATWKALPPTETMIAIQKNRSYAQGRLSNRRKSEVHGGRVPFRSKLSVISVRRLTL